jgi:ubiquinone/menaquinone biosynthesis C-methylase UbiE
MARRTRHVTRAGKVSRSTIVAEPPSPAGTGEHPAHERFGNPEHLEEYLRKLEDPARAEWQKPDEVVRALEIRPEAVIGEIGAGSGYFTLRLARVATHVFASDADPRLLEVLREHIAAAGVRNVTPVLGLAEDPFLPSARCDLILSVNAYHHFPEAPSYLRRVRRALRPGGRIAVVDFHEKLERARLLRDTEAAGLCVAAEHGFLPQQHFVVFQ